MTSLLFSVQFLPTAFGSVKVIKGEKKRPSCYNWRPSVKSSHEIIAFSSGWQMCVEWRRCRIINVLVVQRRESITLAENVVLSLQLFFFLSSDSSRRLKLYESMYVCCKFFIIMLKITNQMLQKAVHNLKVIYILLLTGNVLISFSFKLLALCCKSSCYNLRTYSLK